MMSVMPQTECCSPTGRCASPRCSSPHSAGTRGRPDAIVGYDLDHVTITDPHVIATSGSNRHPILKPGGPRRRSRHVFSISEAELAAADAYEVDDYVRVRFRCARADGVGVRVAGQDERSPLRQEALRAVRRVLRGGHLAVDADLAVRVGSGLPTMGGAATWRKAHCGSANVVVNVHGASGETVMVSRFM